MSDGVLSKVQNLVDLSYIVNGSRIKWSDDDDKGVDAELQTNRIDNSVDAKELTTLVKKMRSSLMKGYNLHIKIKFSL